MMQESGSETPMSDLIDYMIKNNCIEAWGWFLNAFGKSQVGVIGVPEAPRDVGLAHHFLIKGQMILAFADPGPFLDRFGHESFNGLTTGDNLLQSVLKNRNTDGILVNSALAEVSVIIDRDTVQSLVPLRKKPPTVIKPWWRFW